MTSAASFSTPRNYFERLKTRPIIISSDAVENLVSTSRVSACKNIDSYIRKVRRMSYLANFTYRRQPEMAFSTQLADNLFGTKHAMFCGECVPGFAIACSCTQIVQYSQQEMCTCQAKNVQESNVQ